MLPILSLLISGFIFVNPQNPDVLTTNFFDNLKAHPNLGEDLAPFSKKFIDDQIENYLKLMIGEEKTSFKKKRSLLDKFTKTDEGTFLLSGVKPAATIPVRFPEDVLFFEQNSERFVAALESPSVKEPANYLVIFGEENFEKVRTPITNGTKLAAVNLQNSTLIAVAENATLRRNLHEKSAIYEFDGSTLVKIHTIDMSYGSDVAFWKIHDEVYFAIAQSHETEIPIYKWQGGHFDLVQKVESRGARKVTPFVAKNVNFFAVANFKDDKGNTKVYSEIYKFDYHLEKYQLYQRILTKACRDIQVFSLVRKGDRKNDVFLVVANSYEQDPDGTINYETESIIYKFVNEYFIPFQSIRLNGVQQWLPVQTSESFVLFASTLFEGVKTFQYDGWSFQEIPQKLTKILEDRGTKSLRFVPNSTLAVANKNNNGKIVNIFQLEFTHEKPLNDIYDEMITWCDDSLKKIEELSNSEILGERADIDEENDEFEENKEIERKIDTLIEDLEQIEINLKSRDISAKEIIFNNVTFVNNLNTTRINDFPAEEFLENVLDIDEGFDLDEISIPEVTSDSIKVKTLNGHDSDTLIHNSDNLTLGYVKVRGNLRVSEVKLNGKLNGVLLKKNNLLQTFGNQNFSQPLKINNVKVGNMFAKSLNGRSLLKTVRPIIGHIENLTVQNLTLGGYINDVDVPTLEKFALKKSGNQEIYSDFVFDVLEGKNLEVFGNISGKKLTDLIGIDRGNYSITHGVTFNDIFVNDFQVSEFLNEIKVLDGHLDVLLKNSSETQEITGDKIFHDVNIYHAISLQGHINSINLEKMNPVVSIDGNIFLQGDKTINGLVEVEGLVRATDVVTSGGSYSLAKLEQEGLKLTTRKIQPHLRFVQQLNVEEIFADSLNGKSPDDFVVVGTEQPQIIEAVKTFSSNLNVTGATNALKINNIDVEDLENKVLKIEGDQVVVGKHHVKHVVAERIWSNDTVFNKNLTFGVARSENLTLNEDLQWKIIKAESVTVKGFINDLPFDEIVDDTVTKLPSRVVGGHKYFKSLKVDVLDVENGVRIDEIPDRFDELKYEAPLNITNIKIDNLIFENECNGIHRTIFGKYINDSFVDGDQEFERIVIYGNTQIVSNKINNIEITHLLNNTVKIDEPHEFNFVNFESGIESKAPVILEGHIENLDFENIIMPNRLNSVVFDEKAFSNLTINGTINFDGTLNNINISQFCKFAMGELEDKNLTIIGNAVFAKGPNIGKINGADVKIIKDNAWFSDENTRLTGSAHFEDVIFKNDVTVDGFVDNISLNLLYENYFSKTKNQNITARFSFENDLIFESDATVPTMTAADVNGVDLDEFVRSALLDDYDQVFEIAVFLENCYIEKLTGEFTVNGLELNNDVMRYDKVNMVSGFKIFKNLNVESLKLDKNIKIQEVDILEWFKNCVLKTTNYNITGNKIFKNAVFTNGFLLDGTLNGQKFDAENILLRNLPQDITGIKTINSTPLNPVTFKGIKMKGLLNNIDVSDLVKNQAYKNQNNVFKTRINLYNNLIAKNLIIKKLYQGINITELITNVTNLGVLNNLVNQYQKLMDMSYKLESSMRGQAYFLHDYKITQTIISVRNSQKILCPDGATRIGILTNDGHGTRMDLYGLDSQSQLSINATIHLGSQPSYIDQVLMGRFLYTEGDDGLGHFSKIANPNNPVAVPTNFTISTTSFFVPLTQEPCTLFIYENNPPKIFCESQNQIKLKQILERKALKASSVTIGGTLHLIIVTQPSADMESHLEIWSFNNKTLMFQPHQLLLEAHPQSISTIFYDGFYYLAIASGHLETAMYSGRVEIRRFDETTLQFIPWQSLELDAPVQIEFSILPTQELILYVVTSKPSNPLLVFRYEGISKFQLKITGSALPQIMYLNQMGAADRHFIIAQSYDEINVIQAVFKGEKVV